MFGHFWKSKEKKAEQCVRDLSQMFPNYLDVAKGRSGTDKVPDCVAFHPVILGFYYGFAFSVIFTASKKLRFDEETNYRIIYQAICNFFNRPNDFQEFGYRIMRLEDSKDSDFEQCVNDGADFAVKLGMRIIANDRSADDTQTVVVGNVIRDTIAKVMEENDI